VGNRLYRDDSVQSTTSELYSYDGVNQIKSQNRSGHAEAWDYDATGNWEQFNKNGTIENRLHNKANEITSYTHDNNGNMLTLPNLSCKYDAWNRLVEVRDSSNALLASYIYNGLNQRVKKTVNGITTESFFNSAWQELESTELQSLDCTTYVWGLRYIDDLVLREKGEEKLYALADANWNAVALSDNSGTILERMKYDAFGKITWLDSAFTAKANSAYAWNRTFTGQVLDSETDLMLYRNRFYHTGLGRFIMRDPIGYDGKDVSLYRYVRNMPNKSLDTFGFSALVPLLVVAAVAVGAWYVYQNRNSPKTPWNWCKTNPPTPTLSKPPVQAPVTPAPPKPPVVQSNPAPKSKPSKQDMLNKLCKKEGKWWMPNGVPTIAGCVTCAELSGSNACDCQECCDRISRGPKSTSCYIACNQRLLPDGLGAISEFVGAIEDIFDSIGTISDMWNMWKGMKQINGRRILYDKQGQQLILMPR
jgi:RHS repeat-associated protein